MKFYDTTLKQLHDMTAEKKRLDAKYADLKAQAVAYEEQLVILKRLLLDGFSGTQLVAAVNDTV